MFKNKNEDGSLNLCGPKIALLRKQRRLSQRVSADQLQLKGMNLNKNAIQQIESGRRFVTDNSGRSPVCSIFQPMSSSGTIACKDNRPFRGGLHQLSVYAEERNTEPILF